MPLFATPLNNWDDWFNTFQSTTAFTPLVQHIFEKEGLPMAELENTKPGTNAVFKVGNYVIKIFAPHGLEEDFGIDASIELFGLRWAEMHNVPAPKLIAEGAVQDTHYFRYMIMSHIPGKLLSEIQGSLSYDEKVIIGQKVREITDELNKPCENFTPIDVLQYAIDNEEWGTNEGFPISFQTERLAYLRTLHIDEAQKVYCHGDFHAENVLVDENLDVYIVDFADAMHAPAEYEEVYVVSALFCFEKPYIMGYYGEYNVDKIVDLCVTWLLIHAHGDGETEGHLKSAAEITSLDVMRKRLYALVQNEKRA